MIRFKVNTVPDSVFRNPLHFIAFGFGFGSSPVMPGTCGSLIALPLYLLFADWPRWAYGCVVVAALAFGVWLCQKTSADIGVHDHAGIVWDEIVGIWITLFAVPVSWFWCGLAFILFRFFDIWKPWPIRKLDREMHNGLGIMLDDVIAACYAWLILQVFLYVI